MNTIIFCIVLSGVLGTSFARNLQDEVCICTEEYMPVCGSDQVTYGNMCMFVCEVTHKHSANLKFNHEGVCHEARVDAIEDCACPLIAAPVCGSDGRTYINECEFACEVSHHKNANLKINNQGVCHEARVEAVEDCICPFIMAPLCGTDGRTYNNECEFACEVNHNKNANLKIKNQGVCHEARVEAVEDCNCPLMMAPLCGSDGRTYNNECEFACEVNHNKNANLKIKNQGVCHEARLEAVEDCICPLIMAPLCGTDGRTYNNECEFACEVNHNKNANLKIKNQGVCHEARGEAVEDCICPLNMAPLCGTDGRTYNNECEFACEVNHNKNANLKIKNQGVCHEARVEAVEDCICPLIMAPLCGTDGRTYNNECEFACEVNHNKNANLKIKNQGVCHEARVEAVEDCICPLNMAPLCGTDGRTYNNECEFACEVNHNKNANLKIKNQGVCHEARVEAVEDCICPLNMAPLCGTDGRTYNNECEFACEVNHNKNANLKIKNQGVCHEARVEAVEDCICPFNMAPLCGTDGRTYNNECEFACEVNHNKNANLKIKNQGVCHEARVEAVEDCICPFNMAPLCGTDGRTYNNECEFACEVNHNKNANLKIKNQGVCHEARVEAVENCICPFNFAPLCGSDGRTYNNVCEFACEVNHNKNANLKIKNEGVCHEARQY